MTETITLELACGRCGQWLIRWSASLAEPFGQQVPIIPHVVSPTAVRTEGPGSYRRATDGRWYRWAPGPARLLPDGEVWARYVFECPNGCPTSPQALVDKLEDAAAGALRALHATRTPLLRTTVDSLLRWSA